MFKHDLLKMRGPLTIENNKKVFYWTDKSYRIQIQDVTDPQEL